MNKGKMVKSRTEGKSMTKWLVDVTFEVSAASREDAIRKIRDSLDLDGEREVVVLRTIDCKFPRDPREPEKIRSKYWTATVNQDGTYTLWDGLGCEWSGLSLTEVQKLDAADFYPKFQDSKPIIGR